jgi:release factor glutamine methyltransferase
MTLAQLYLQSRKRLAGATADFDLSQLFHAHFGWQPGLRRAEAEVTPDEAFVFSHKVRRLSEGYPLQYLLGEWEFYSIPLKVGEGVLIPRPDTEVLVDTALSLAAALERPVIADFCAGSGAIALAVAANLPGASLYAVELSPDALRYCRENVAQHEAGRRVQVVEGDVLKPLALPALDMILCNPPYLTRKELEELPGQVRHEPVMALDGGEDGLVFYRGVAAQAADLLLPGGRLIFETGWRQAADVAGILAQQGYEGIEIRKDLTGIERCVFASRPAREGSPCGDRQ